MTRFFRAYEDAQRVLPTGRDESERAPLADWLETALTGSGLLDEVEAVAAEVEADRVEVAANAAEVEADKDDAADAAAAAVASAAAADDARDEAVAAAAATEAAVATGSVIVDTKVQDSTPTPPR